MKYIIGTDLGTTSTKSVLYSTDGKVIASANIEYPLYHDVPDMAEEDPQQIWNAVVNSIQQVSINTNKSDILGIAFSSAMHSLILLDEQHQPLTRVITWADNRAAKYAEELKHSELGQQIYQATGTPIHAMSPLAKLIWLNHDAPELLSQAKFIVGIKEYIIYRLTGELKMDYSMANATGFFNLHEFNWDQPALDLTSISTQQLPDLVDTDYIIDHLTTKAADATQLTTHTKVIMGASDGALSNLGVGADKPGVAAITIGTSGAVRVMTDKPYLDPKGRLFCYYVTKNRWIVGGPVNNGGQVFRWIRDVIYQTESDQQRTLNKDPYDLITSEAANAPIGAHGLVLLPFMSGERAPLWDANARGSLIGLTPAHTKADIARATLEGIVLNLNTVLNLTKSAANITEIRATGGFARSPLWRQILTDVLGIQITIPDSFESSCLAAVVIGLKALGEIDSINAIHTMIGKTTQYQPITDNQMPYEKLNQIYRILSDQLEPVYRDLADYQRSIQSED